MQTWATTLRSSKSTAMEELAQARETHNVAPGFGGIPGRGINLDHLVKQIVCFTFRTVLMIVECIRAVAADKAIAALARIVPEPIKRWWLMR